MSTRGTVTLHRSRRLLLAGLLALGGLAPLAPGLAQPVSPVRQSDTTALLRPEDRGPLVNQLQTELADLGLFAGVVDGHYGADTAEAVRSLQAQQGLVVDGIVGPQTWRALKTARRAATLPPPLLTANLFTFTPLVVAQPSPPPPAIWLALMPLVPIAGGALTCLHRRRGRRQRVTLPFKPKL
ncbi:peptidoglycan-binding protein [Nodosilinea sp. FACHB-131]|uniref:peptidoglycan-binding domain-containing protein n=1 Tax=Cyanophyceae TaxID=3028117 RepID=UPI001682CD3B|nr:peptidoglycan-binding domain-containing protein [Nodosilinea sp. FACHB-131]MBD1873113.1 peptidoglycan-binding protein [Nodosilinea sp. FACHB-131]